MTQSDIEQDANHNVTAITDTGGNVKERIVYDPYGAQTVLNSSWAATSDTYTWIYGFQGGRYDSYAGLYNFQRREYDPTLGRWMQQDPAGYVDGKNLYRALTDSPVDFVDPLGLQTQPAGGGLPTPQPSGVNQYSNLAATAEAQPGAATQPRTAQAGARSPLRDLPSDVRELLNGLDNAAFPTRDNAHDQLLDALLKNPGLRPGLEAAQGSGFLTPEQQSRLDEILFVSAVADPPSLAVRESGTLHVKFAAPLLDDAIVRFTSADPDIAFPVRAGAFFNWVGPVNRFAPAGTVALDEPFEAGWVVGTTTITIELFYPDPGAVNLKPMRLATSVKICVFE